MVKAYGVHLDWADPRCTLYACQAEGSVLTGNRAGAALLSGRSPDVVPR